MCGNTRFLTGLLVWMAIPAVVLALAADAVEAGSPGEAVAEKAILGFEEVELSRGTKFRGKRNLAVRVGSICSSSRWEGPRDLTDEFNLHEYRSLPGFSVPPYAPANYVPLVWSDFDEGTVKLLKVPVTTAKR